MLIRDRSPLPIKEYLLYLILLPIGCFLTMPAMCQETYLLNGTVRSGAGQPIANVSVVIKNSNQGTTTSTEGGFSLQVRSNDTLVFTSVGYLDHESPVNNSRTLEVVLQESSGQLDQVVVVGYSTQKKANLTGAVSVVSGRDIASRQVGQTSMALQGMAPGVTVTQASGQPGKDGGTIRIRGIGTLSDADPLVVVDGVPNDINNIDPAIIENITVLKDAASASIYGARAANGVILITTKRGANGRFSFGYTSYVGLQEPTDLKQRVNAVDHMKMINTANVNVGRAPIFSEDLIKDYPTLHASDPVTYPDTDWFKELFTRNGFMQNHSINFNGGTDRISVMGSLGYHNQDAIFENAGFKRYSLRLNSDIKVSSKLKIKADFFLRFMQTDEPGSGVQQVLFYGNHLASVEPVRNAYGFAVPSTGSNSVAMLHEGGYNQTLTPSIMTTLGFTYHLMDDLFVDFNYTPHFWENERKNFKTIIDVYYPNGDLFAPGSQVANLLQSNDKYLQNNLWATLNYRKSLNGHNFKLLVGGSQEDFKHRWYSAFRDNYSLPQYDVLNAGGSGNQQTAGAGSDWALRSLFGRLNYDLDGRYLFEANFRYDGSSRFATGNKYGFFPSFSAGWRISQEKFWNNISETLNEFKLRASWGKLGNQNIGTYPFDAFLTSNLHSRNGININGLAPTEVANSKISWESTKMLNIGTDMEFWKKLTVSFDYYHKRTSGILLRLDVPTIIGLNAPYQNAGIVENKGWDFSLGYSGRINEFTYRLFGTLSDVKNKIVDLRGVNIEGLVVNFEGHPMNSFYGYESIGFFQSASDVTNSPKQFGNVIPGGIKYKDQNGDNQINGEDRIIIGNQIPRYTYSLNGSFGWRGFDLSVMLQGVGKADGYLYGTAIMPFNNGSTALEMHKDYWTPENPQATFPSLTFNEPNNIQNSSFWKKDASYLRLKNLQLGYTIGDNLLRIIKVKKIRVYAAAQNLLTVDNFWDGFDVEAPVGIGDYYPQVKTYSMGININF